MKKVNDELTDLFCSRLEDAEMSVREGFWENLENEIPVVLSRRSRIIRRFAAAASVLLVLAGASAAFIYFSPQEEIADAFTQVAISTGTTGNMGVDVAYEKLPDIHASTTSPVPASLKPVAAIEEDEEESFSVSFSMSFSYSSSSSGQDRNNTSRYDRQSSYVGGFENNHTPASSSQTAEETATVLSVEKEKQRTWSLGAFASGGFLRDNNQVQSIQPFVANNLTGNYGPGTIKHKQPVTVGLTIRKELSDRFGIESGLMYTQLNSELSSGDVNSYTQDQKLHYIGIPIKADITLYQNKRVNLYAAAGGAVEKCVSGKVKTRYYEHGDLMDTENNSLKADPLQLSVMAAVGVQYKLNDRLSLYAEPGLSYHFDDGSPVVTIRKEKPLNMNLLCGVRMTY